MKLGLTNFQYKRHYNTTCFIPGKKSKGVHFESSNGFTSSYNVISGFFINKKQVKLKTS
uniref:Uncharacterized protein n=1 Tax=Tetranychus urticae TaxID=32264 RepID=T1KKN1_TETUR